MAGAEEDLLRAALHWCHGEIQTGLLMLACSLPMALLARRHVLHASQRRSAARDKDAAQASRAAVCETAYCRCHFWPLAVLAVIFALFGVGLAVRTATYLAPFTLRVDEDASAFAAAELERVNAFMSRFRPVRMAAIFLGVSAIMARRWTRAALRRATQHGGSAAAVRKFSVLLSWILFLLFLVLSVIALDHFAEKRGDEYRGALERFLQLQ